MSNNWAEMGIEWSEEEVSERAGSNATDKRVLGKAQIAVVNDLDKFTATFGKEAVLAIMDGTSVRVRCQDIGRAAVKAKLSVDQNRERVVNWLKGVRNTGTTKIVREYVLPNGKSYKGASLVEYQLAYVEALVDQGIDGSVATQIASGLKVEGLE